MMKKYFLKNNSIYFYFIKNKSFYKITYLNNNVFKIKTILYEFKFIH